MIEPCPCGRTPEALCIEGEGLPKYARVSGDCCSDWSVEFRNDYNAIDSGESKKLATRALNAAKRGNACPG